MEHLTDYLLGAILLVMLFRTYISFKMFTQKMKQGERTITFIREVAENLLLKED